MVTTIATLAALPRLHQDFISSSLECDTPCASTAFTKKGLVHLQLQSSIKCVVQRQEIFEISKKEN
ncbi:Uncharacterized protein APZ42_009592 [Daphnia magna]|uniref:Uncharacterized protein n=1 Tax=Daphnia magna TaxID=35525 RepID=A0A164DXD5_9CRUS|nr:Uncharacterized protein APZ42_009592 [Daphnia magna]